MEKHKKIMYEMFITRNDIVIIYGYLTLKKGAAKLYVSQEGMLEWEFSDFILFWKGLLILPCFY